MKKAKFDMTAFWFLVVLAVAGCSAGCASQQLEYYPAPKGPFDAILIAQEMTKDSVELMRYARQNGLITEIQHLAALREMSEASEKMEVAIDLFAKGLISEGTMIERVEALRGLLHELHEQGVINLEEK